MSSLVWQRLFETYDPGVTSLPVEVRHPYLDVRIADYLLAVPAIPWCVNKQLLREALRGVLPEPVRNRPKSPLAEDPVGAKWRTSQERLNRIDRAPQLARYVDDRALPRITGRESDDVRWANLRPINLNYWLLGLNDT